MKAIKTIKKLRRKILLALLDRAAPDKLEKNGEKKLLRLFRKARYASPALAKMLKDNRIEAHSVKNIGQFTALDFLMTKENSFNAFSLEELCRPGMLNDLQAVLTSSGHSGNFAYGLTGWKQGGNTPELIDLALQANFQVDDRKTLLVNCLPMGVRFPSNVVTQAEVSVREDMALALIRKFSPHYDQVIIVCDPLFLKLLMDESDRWQVDWRNIHTHLIIGEETFGENYRNYVGRKLHIDPDNPASGIIGSSMGVGELGLNLCFETLETIALRRKIRNHPALMENLFGCVSDRDPLPMLFAYNPLSSYMEIRHPDARGYGDLLVSILDKNAAIPLFRYQTGDEARLLKGDEIARAFQGQGLPAPALPKMPMICIRGRDRDRLASGLHIGAVKDALYRNPEFADHISGAFRLKDNDPMAIDIQLRRGEKTENITAPDIPGENGILIPSENVTLWDYDSFPYGKSIDYERKFSYLG